MRSPVHPVPLRGGPAVALLFFALASVARPDPLTITWQGGASGAWQDSANWSPAIAPGGPGGEEHAVTISSSAVALGEDATVASLALDSATLSGPGTLTCSALGLTLSGANTFAADLGVVVLQNFGFANAEASLDNHGTLIIGQSGLLLEVGATPGAIAGTLINAFDGVLRFNPNTVIELEGEVQGTLIEPITVGAPVSFSLINLGTILVDESREVDVYAALFQRPAARLVAKASCSISLWGGGTVSGNIVVDPTAQVRLVGVTGLYGEPLVSYTLDQTRVSGGGGIFADRVVLAGSLSTGALRAESCELEEAFNNHGQLTLRYTNARGGLVNHPGAFLRWLHGTTLMIPSRLTNHGTLQFDRGAPFYGSGFAGYSSTIENAADGVIRFDPTGTGRVGSGIGTPPFRIENAGTLLSDNQPTPGYNLSNSIFVPLQNTGLIRVTAGSALSITPGTFSQTKGETRVEEAELSGGATIPLTFAGGLLRATGKLNGPVVVGSEAALEIGLAQAAGTLRFTGSLTLSPGAQIHLDLVPTEDNASDRLLVTGALQLDGRLRVRLAPELAATLTPETTFTVATAGTVTGSFANIHAGRVWTTDGSGSFQVSQTTASVILVDYCPAPAFEGWQHRYWPDADDPAIDGRADADPDADGLPNLLEYALGRDPTAPQTAAWCDTDVASSRLRLTFTPRVTAGLAYTIQTSRDLETWQTSPLPNLVADVPCTYVDTVDLVPGEKRFLRLVVSPLPDDNGE